MSNSMLQIPFVLNSKQGNVEVCYEVNNSASKSGFDLFKKLGFDVKMCIGYPTMHAYIKNYAGTGYYTSSAWIQIITDKFYESLDDNLPVQEVSEVDVHPNMRKLGVPFFSFGYPAEIYDAPCNNLGEYKRLKWIADTFLVTQPSRINNDTISCLLGFRWGYEESDKDGIRQVKVFPIEVIDKSVWSKHIPLLREHFPDWIYE